jgi:hypothetical protein
MTARLTDEVKLAQVMAERRALEGQLAALVKESVRLRARILASARKKRIAQRNAHPPITPVKWTPELCVRAFVLVLDGGTWKQAGAIAGVSGPRVAQVVNKLCRQLWHPSMLTEPAPAYCDSSLYAMREHREFWMRQLRNYAPDVMRSIERDSGVEQSGRG